MFQKIQTPNLKPRNLHKNLWFEVRIRLDNVKKCVKIDEKSDVDRAGFGFSLGP
jgi:hypothetical protein